MASPSSLSTITPRTRIRASMPSSARRLWVMDWRICSICLVPSRQGMHLPQLSDWMNSMKNLARSTMQVFSSSTTRPPEPMMAPKDLRAS